MEIRNQAWSERMLSVLRIVAGLLFLEHGLAKLFGFPHIAMFENLQLVSLIGLAGLIEIVGGALLSLGLYTRVAAFVMSGEMAFAYFMSHAARGFFPILNGGELAVLYCSCSCISPLPAAGPGVSIEFAAPPPAAPGNWRAGVHRKFAEAIDE